MKKILSSTSYIWLLNRRSTVYGMIRFDIEMKDFVLSNPTWDQYKLINSALATSGGTISN